MPLVGIQIEESHVLGRKEKNEKIQICSCKRAKSGDAVVILNFPKGSFGVTYKE